jgi:hypothetical protein
MDNLNKHFFSPENMQKLAKVLCKKFNVESSNKDGKSGVVKALKVTMNKTWENGEYQFKDLLRKHPVEAILSHLNKKTLDTIFAGKRDTRKSTGQMNMDREREIYGNRKVRIGPNGENTRQIAKNRQSGGIMDSDPGSGFGYASFDNSLNGGFFTADGRVGNNFQIGIDQNQYIQGGSNKRDASEYTEQRFLQMQQERKYQNGGVPGQNGQNGQNAQELFSYQQRDPYGMQRPTEINFRLDGTDSRVKDRDEFGNPIDKDQQMAQMMGGNNDFNGNMDYFTQLSQMQGQNGGNPMQNGMNPMQNGMNPMQNGMNPMQNGMNPMQQQQMQLQMSMNQSPNMQMEQMMAMCFEQMMNKMLQTGNNEMQTYSNVGSNLKKSIANKLNVDAQTMLNMSSSDIKRLIEKKKKEESESDDDNKSDSSEESNKKTKKPSKNTAISAILKLKEENIKKQKDLDKFVQNQKNKKKVESESESDSESDSDNGSETQSDDSDIKQKRKSNKKTNDKNKKTNDKNKKVQKTKKREDSEEKSDTESDEEEKPVVSKSNKKVSPVKQQSEKMSPNKQKQLKARILEIDCASIEDNPDTYHDYMVNFGDYYDNLVDDKYIPQVKKITLTSVDIKLSPVVTEKVSTFKIIHKDNPKVVRFADGDDYTIEEIIEGINDQYKSADINVILSCKNGIVTIRNLDNEPFEIECGNDSIRKLLGFTKKTAYTGASRYMAEQRHAFNNGPVYLYLKNINENKAFAKINPDKSFKQLFDSLETGVDLENLVIQFRNKETNNDDNDIDLVNLGQQPHTLIFKFEHL